MQTLIIVGSLCVKYNKILITDMLYSLGVTCATKCCLSKCLITFSKIAELHCLLLLFLKCNVCIKHHFLVTCQCYMIT